ncbi:MAG: spore cortex biosynthesis protein YabQ [Defluviitaleaceae bacterium]|nr:spore cortex biosynthesis protein YabQ [Defluviitaleaceae bacterium]
MILDMGAQAWLFLSTVLAGAVIGVFYDFFRILRRVATRFNTAWLVTLEDFLFWVIVTFGMFYFMLNQNFGEIRFFSILGAGSGMAIYFATLSRFFVKIGVAVVNYIKKVIVTALRIIFLPIRIIAGWISPLVMPILQKARSGLIHLVRYGKIRMKKTNRNLFILRKKV